MKDYTASDEAKATRRARAQLHRTQTKDPLAERQRLIAFWRNCAQTNRGYLPHHGAWWWPFMRSNFRHLCMPALRRLLDERDQAFKAKYQAELRESVLRFRQLKAERAAAKARASAPQRDMLDDVMGAAQ